MNGLGETSSIRAGPSQVKSRRKRNTKSLQDGNGNDDVQSQQLEFNTRDDTMRSLESNESNLRMNGLGEASSIRAGPSRAKPRRKRKTKSLEDVNGSADVQSQQLEFNTRDDTIHSLESNESAPPLGFRKRSYRPRREAHRLSIHIARYGVAGNVKRVGGIRGPNKLLPLIPDFTKGEGKRPIYWSQSYRPFGGFTSVFSRYCGYEASNYARFPLHTNWGLEHDNNFERFFVKAQDYYEFFGPLDPEDDEKKRRLPWNEEAVRSYLRKSMQTKVIGRRHTVKHDYFLRWKLAKTQAERKLIENNLDYERVPLSAWPALCAFLDSDAKKAQSIRNSINRNSTINDCPTYTGGTDCMSRVEEKAIEEKGADNCTAADIWIYAHTSKNPESGEIIYPNESTRRYADKIQAEIQNQSLELPNGSSLSDLTPILDAVSGGHHGGSERGLGLGPTRKKLKEINKETRLERELKEKCKKFQAEITLLKEQQQQREDSCPTLGIGRSADSMVPQVPLEQIIGWFGGDGLNAMYDAAIRARNANTDQAAGPSYSRQHDENNF